ncbi:hypothetical protein CapIbe_011658 [Capra ibex]
MRLIHLQHVLRENFISPSLFFPNGKDPIGQTFCWGPGLDPIGRCGYFLDDHPSGIHLTSSTPGEAVLHAKQAPTLILSEWL